MRRGLVMVVLALAGLLAAASPAFAINDIVVPAGNCAAPNSQAVGHPAAPVLLGIFGGLPVSENTPGASTGAQGQAHSQAPCK
jgi:hypothetical protein